MWQKAKIVKHDYCPIAIGKFVWVKVGSPQRMLSRNRFTGESYIADRFIINGQPESGLPISMRPSYLELYPEFIKAPPAFFTFDQFKAGEF